MIETEQEILRIEETATGSKITIEHAHFAFASAELSETTKKHIQFISEKVEESSDKNIEIHAYTDSMGTTEYNQGLSLRRAENAKSELIRDGIAAERIVTYGKGESNPVAENSTEEGRANNRRIEFYLKDPIK